jgi:hypothetical protein
MQQHTCFKNEKKDEASTNTSTNHAINVAIGPSLSWFLAPPLPRTTKACEYPALAMFRSSNLSLFKLKLWMLVIKRFNMN